MLNLKQYRATADRLSDHLPWAALVAPGIVLNKDGSFQRTFRYRGPDIESATPQELIAVCARLNNTLRRFGSGWALFFEACRTPAPAYPEVGFETGVAQLVDAERRAIFVGEATSTFETNFYFTLVFLPDPDQADAIGSMVMETSAGKAVTGTTPWIASSVARTRPSTCCRAACPSSNDSMTPRP